MARPKQRVSMRTEAERLLGKPTPQEIETVIANLSRIQILMLGGFAGAATRMILAPDANWRAWFVAFFVGVMSALFIGGGISEYFSLSPWGWAMAAYVCGSVGEKIVQALQRRLVVEIRGDDK